MALLVRRGAMSHIRAVDRDAGDVLPGKEACGRERIELRNTGTGVLRLPGNIPMAGRLACKRYPVGKCYICRTRSIMREYELMAQTLPLSVAIISYNEADNIERTLKSVGGLAQEIVVVDSHSSDETPAIAERCGARVFSEGWKGHIAQKNSALEKCSQPWVLSLDADEVVSTELAASIRSAVQDGGAAGYSLNRKTFYLGKFLHYAWQPDWKLRLVRRDAQPQWGGYNPHDVLAVQGPTARLNGYLHHYSYKDLEDHFLRTVRYARLSAQSYYGLGKRFSLAKLLLNPVFAGFKKLVLQRAFLDGYRGCLVAMSAAFSVFLKYMFLWEIANRDTQKPTG